MQHAAEFRRCLEDIDIEGLRRAWQHVAPHLPQPESDWDCGVAAHRARTQAESIHFDKRAYSHAWLIERGLPSGLPDYLKPRAQRMYPVVVGVVGISCNSSSSMPERKQFTALVQGVMEDRVNDMYADGVTDPLKVKPAIMDARAGVYRKLLGIKL